MQIHTSSSSDSGSLISKQRSNLIAAINEAKKLEIKRTKRLALVEGVKSLSWKFDQLNERYEKERKRDQLKIQQLVDDYRTVQNLKSIGELDQIINYRKCAPLKPQKISSEEHDRFYKMTYDSDIIAWKGICNTFEKHDSKASRKVAPKFDMYSERKKLELLNHKKDLLSHLVEVQRNELKTVNAPVEYKPDFKCIKEFDCRSQKSAASYATFLSKDSSGKFKPPSNHQRPRFVPSLNLPASRN